MMHNFGHTTVENIRMSMPDERSRELADLVLNDFTDQGKLGLASGESCYADTDGKRDCGRGRFDRLIIHSGTLLRWTR